MDLLRRRLGQVEVIGSVALDMMVWPDIDLYACLAPDEGMRLVSLMPEVYELFGVRGLTVVKTSFYDEYQRSGSAYGHGLYVGFWVLSADGTTEWKVDLWGWDAATCAAQMEKHRRLAAALTGVDRDVILRIKDAVWDRPEYRRTLTSVDVYDFVLSGAGSTVAEFEAFLACRGDVNHSSA